MRKNKWKHTDKHPFYTVWRSMIDRCRNPNNPFYQYYGGRGITICERWLNSFDDFVEDMGERPEGYTLDRINTDGNYSPENCRWASRQTQQRNRRIGLHQVTLEGVTYIIMDLARSTGMKPDTLINRAKTAKTLDELINPRKKVYKEGLALGANASGAKKRALTHCKHGHEFTPENTQITPQGWRRCRACHREKMRRRQGYYLGK